jgi:hypothetical protein
LSFIFGDELGLDPGEAATVPVALDHGVDEEGLERADGVAGLVVSFGQSGELGGVLAGQDVGLGVNAVFQGVEAVAALPSVEVGPVDLKALRRLAWIWRMVAMLVLFRGQKVPRTKTVSGRQAGLRN